MITLLQKNRYAGTYIRQIRRVHSANRGVQGAGRLPADTAGPEMAAFRDYTGLDLKNGHLAVVSQESSALWTGRIGAGRGGPDNQPEDGGRIALFPRDGNSRVLYGNIEGVAGGRPHCRGIGPGKRRPAEAVQGEGPVGPHLPAAAWIVSRAREAGCPPRAQAPLPSPVSCRSRHPGRRWSTQSRPRRRVLAVCFPLPWAFFVCAEAVENRYCRTAG